LDDQSPSLGTQTSEHSIDPFLAAIWNDAQISKSDPIKLLAILRKLESLHQEIRDTLFQEALPENRQALYTMLKDIEAKGGWPYIYRLRLRELMERLSQGDLETLFPNEDPPPPT